MSASKKRRKERILLLEEICRGAIESGPLTDEELEFLTKYFRWNDGLLEKIEEIRQRPYLAYPDGFYKECGTCHAFKNYCCCWLSI